MFYKWNCAVGNLLELFFFFFSTQHYLPGDVFKLLNVSKLCSFLLWGRIPWMYHSLLNLSSVGGHLGCFQFGAAMNKVAINTPVCIFV